MKHHLISCPIFAKELDVVLAEISNKPVVHLMDYAVHISAESMQKELSQAIKTAQGKGAAITLLVGQDCQAQQPINHIANSCCGTMPQELNCIEMLLGQKKTKELQESRTSIMTPAWFKMIKSSIDQGLWTVEDARINLGWYDQILLLDTGVEALDEAMIMEFFELIQVPIDILPITLDHFKRVIHKLLSHS
nr:DUF1638 domain-containing protein [Desulfobulbaceae bacterium]